MNKSLFLISAFFLSLFFSIEKVIAESSSKALKLNCVISENKANQVYPVTQYHQSQIGITNFLPAINFFKSNGNFNELGIQNFSINHSEQSIITRYDSAKIEYVNGISTSNFNIQFCFEKNIRIFKKKDSWKLNPFIGFSMNPFVNYIKFIPLSSSNFSASIRNFGALINVIPRLQYNLTSNFFVDLNLPITMAQFNSYHQKTSNPNYSKSQNEVGGLNFDMLFKVSNLRIGLGYRI